jgi:hypothetical protein
MMEMVRSNDPRLQRWNLAWGNHQGQRFINLQDYIEANFAPAQRAEDRAKWAQTADLMALSDFLNRPIYLSNTESTDPNITRGNYIFRPYKDLEFVIFIFN